MYKLTMLLSNPIANESLQFDLQFDPDTIDQTQWSEMFPFVQGKISQLKQTSADKEPQEWSAAIAAAAATTAPSLS